MNAKHASLTIFLSLLVACSNESSSNGDVSNLAADDASTSASPPAATDAGVVDASQPTPGPSFTVQASELVIKHPGAPGGQSKLYAADVDPSTPEGGQPSMLLQSLPGATDTGFAATTATLEVNEKIIGRRYRMRAKIKTEQAFAGWLWLRIDSPSSFVLDNMRTPVDRRINGTHDWRDVVLVMDVPPDAVRFAFGSGLVGEGKVWVGPITFEEVGSDVNTTPSFGGML